MKQSCLFSLLFVCLSSFTFSQETYQNVSNKAIYSFIDELANDQIISINSTIKPYSRKYIAEKLKEASLINNKLTNRQKDEVDFYLLDYSKELPGFETMEYIGKNYISKDKTPFKKRNDLFYYKDSLFSITINPILGINYLVNKNGSNYHRWNGAEGFANIGKNWGFYVSLRDNTEEKLLVAPSYLTQNTGAMIKKNLTGGGDFEEIKGGITYSWYWGSIGLIKDNFVWGDNYNGSNIFSGLAPSFPFLKFHAQPVKWFELNYVHGWLASGVVDSLRSYSYNLGTRIVYHEKYLAANMFTFTPFRKLNISFGNSIIYSDIGIQPGFLIPVMFFKAVDHSQNGLNNFAGQNSQMFFNISSRQIKHLNLYTSLFVDEISIRNMWNPQKETNYISTKDGFALSDFPLQNLTFITEYTRTNPMTYKHFIPTTTFESNLFNLGHYLRDNAEEIYFSLRWKPKRGLDIDLSYSLAEKGPDYVYTGLFQLVPGKPFLDSIMWKNKNISLSARYEVLHDIFVFVGFTNSNIIDALKIYTPAYFMGKTNTINLGINWGF